MKSIHNGDETLQDEENEQIKLKSNLGHINQGPPQYEPPEQLNTIENVTNLYESREKLVQLFNNYAKNMSKNIYESKQGTGLKILTPKETASKITNNSCTNKSI